VPRPSTEHLDRAPQLRLKKPAARPSAETQARRLALRTSAFDQSRRENSLGLRQQLDRYSDERLDNFYSKLASLDTQKLTRPGFTHPLREMARVRERALALVERDDD